MRRHEHSKRTSNVESSVCSSSDYAPSYRPSVSSMISVDSYSSLPQLLSSVKLQDSLSIEDSENALSDPSSLTNSLSGPLTFQGVGNDATDGDEEEPTASIEISPQPSKKPRRPLFKSLTLSTPTIRDPFDTDLTRASHQLETNLTKLAAESKDSNGTMFAMNSQLADIRLIIQSEKNCSLFEARGITGQGYNHDAVFKSTLNEFDMRVMLILFNQYSRASTIVGLEAAKDK